MRSGVTLIGQRTQTMSVWVALPEELFNYAPMFIKVTAPLQNNADASARNICSAHFFQHLSPSVFSVTFP